MSTKVDRETELQYFRDYMKKRRLDPAFRAKEHSYYKNWYKTHGRKRYYPSLKKRVEMAP